MRIVEIIRKKRDGLTNTTTEIRFLIQHAVQGDLPPYQLSAWLMAVFLRGMDSTETAALTQALIDSGQKVEFTDLSARLVDKHSTGGVGDKTSLIVAPLVASAGIHVPMISGRGLGHTGGTLDKLESIPGFRTDLPVEEFKTAVRHCGLAIVGQSPALAPADGLLYALRDVTATVESIPLIVASIVSKKIAEGIDGLILDVKTGHGAFMKNPSQAIQLARELVTACNRMGTAATALISDMSQPLGRMVGNTLEVQESIQTLKNEGPEDLTHLCLELAAHMIKMGEGASTLQAARSLASEKLCSGAALRKFQELLTVQGGNPAVVEDCELLPKAQGVVEYKAERTGFVQQVRADRIGEAAMLLGAGRDRMSSEIQHEVGLELTKKIGDSVMQGEPLVKVHYNEQSRLDKASKILKDSFRIGEVRNEAPNLIQEVFE